MSTDIDTLAKLSKIRCFSQNESEHNDYGCKCPQILTVDDQKFNRYVVTSLLSSYNVGEASNGQETISIFKKIKECAQCKGANLGLILMDLNMPLMKGDECAAQIRLIEKLMGTRRVAIYIITGDTYDVPKHSKNGIIDGVITKPINKKELTKIAIKSL